MVDPVSASGRKVRADRPVVKEQLLAACLTGANVPGQLENVARLDPYEKTGRRSRESASVAAFLAEFTPEVVSVFH
jgi:hypothetical protein